jgi:hypothetical protein
VAQAARRGTLTFGCGFYGSTEEVRYQKRMSRKKRMVRKVQSLAFTGVMLPAINLFRGIPTDEFVRQAYFKSHARKPKTDIDPARDGCGMVWIAPMVPWGEARGRSRRHSKQCLC